MSEAVESEGVRAEHLSFLWAMLRKRQGLQLAPELPADTADSLSLSSSRMGAGTVRHYSHEPDMDNAGLLCHIRSTSPTTDLAGHRVPVWSEDISGQHHLSGRLWVAPEDAVDTSSDRTPHLEAHAGLCNIWTLWGSEFGWHNRPRAAFRPAPALSLIHISEPTRPY